MAKNNGVPAWVWVGCGCVLCIVLLVGGLTAVGFLGFGMVKKTVEDMADPEVRRAKVEKMLGAEGGLPAGYHAHSTFSFPFSVKLASLSDGPEPKAPEDASFEEKAEMMVSMIPRGDQLGEHTFIYLEARGMRDDQRIEDILGGETIGSTTSVDLSMEFEAEEDLGSGSLDAAGTTVDWRAARGSLNLISGTTDAQWVAVRFRCPDDPPRAAVWIEHPPAEGSLAEPTRLQTFLDHFSPCGE